MYGSRYHLTFPGSYAGRDPWAPQEYDVYPTLRLTIGMSEVYLSHPGGLCGVNCTTRGRPYCLRELCRGATYPWAYAESPYGDICLYPRPRNIGTSAAWTRNEAVLKCMPYPSYLSLLISM